MLLNEPGCGHRVFGELYEVDEVLLKRIDMLESSARRGIIAFKLSITSAADGQRCEAFAYAKASDLARPVHSGYLDDYQDRCFFSPW